MKYQFSLTAVLLTIVLLCTDCYQQKDHSNNTKESIEAETTKPYAENETHSTLIKQPQKDFYKVTKVIDGDTFWATSSEGERIKVRLIGLDAPETTDSQHKKIGYYGEESKQFLNQLIDKKMVRLEFDVRRYDQYKRTLAYAYLEDGTFINALLIENGLATVVTYPPNVQFSELFIRLQKQARKKGKGLWN